MKVAPTKDELHHLYWEKGLSPYQIGLAYGMSHSSIDRSLKRYGLPTRSRSEAQALAYTKDRRRPTKALKGRTGATHPSWKGGTKTAKGYKLCLHPGHPRSDKRGYVLEHIIVWEHYHQRALPEGWVIHHINGIRDDNRPLNLFALPMGNHHNQFLLNALKDRIRALEREVRALRGQGKLL